jgi:hypothetical protein
MARVFHYVLIFEGHWAVRFDHVFRAEKYVTLSDAIAAARQHACERWDLHGLPGGVIFESPDGSEIEDETFG